MSKGDPAGAVHGRTISPESGGGIIWLTVSMRGEAGITTIWIHIPKQQHASNTAGPIVMNKLSSGITVAVWFCRVCLLSMGQKSGTSMWDAATHREQPCYEP